MKVLEKTILILIIIFVPIYITYFFWGYVYKYFDINTLRIDELYELIKLYIIMLIWVVLFFLWSLVDTFE